jgi:hypothetical protein
MKSLSQFDSEYNKSVEVTFDKLLESNNLILKDYEFDLSNIEITEAIIFRLKTYYTTQNKIKIFLDKRYIAAAADYFVESILFFLRIYFKSKGGILEAHSERQIIKEKNSIRPDISIWKGNEVVAIIECKTQLGWNRNNWENDFIDRDIKLKNDFPNAKSFLLVMTGSNWSGFSGNSNLNKNYFCLLKDRWPIEYDNISQIYTPIEGLINQL